MMTQSNNVLEFESLKQTIISIISNANIIVSQKKSCQESGIYLLYVDNFEDKNIIPFYIGQTVNFQQRFKKHIDDIKKLTKYTYAEYHNIFFWSATSFKRAFEGKYRACKIFKYIVDHNCSIDDVKMIVLEKCHKEVLTEREHYYLSEYRPAFFGFNQIATITERFLYRDEPGKKRLLIEEDYQCFEKYIEYGYSTFNYLHAFSGFGNPEIDKKVNCLLLNHFWPQREELLSRSVSAFENYNKVYQVAYKEISDRYAEQIHNIFCKCTLKSKARESEVLAAFVNHFRTVIVDDINSNLDYLEYYFNRDKKSRECGELIRELYNTNADDINQINLSVKIAFEAYINSRDCAIAQSEYSIIFPQKTF